MLLHHDSTDSDPMSAALLCAPEHQLFTSSDLELTRSMVGKVMKPHHLNIAGNGQQLDARMHHIAIGDLTLSRLKYGAQVDIEPECLEHFYLIQMPVSGNAQVSSGKQQIESSSRLASVLSPSDPVRMRWSPDSDQLMLRIPRQRVERAMAAQLGRKSDETIRFKLGMAWRDIPAWRCLVSYLLQCPQEGLEPTQSRYMSAHIEQLAVNTLLCVQPHNLSDAKPAHSTTVMPRHVRKVEDYLRQHIQEPIVIDELAELAGVSSRSLYNGFKQFCGVSPMQYLKQLRLDRAHRDLLESTQFSTVTGVALHWGFDHLGRFSGDYKKRFNESPGDTLRRRQ